ncbi:MAG: hypothetical protein ABEJ31_13335 [Haloarculaceae archaeon]
MSSSNSGAGSPDSELPKRYLVGCDQCSFERDARGADEAQRVAQRHTDETDHDVIAVEYPPNVRRA